MKKAFQKYLVLLLLGVSATLSAQYTEVLNSNRPGFSESPYSVGLGVYQFELGAFYDHTKPIASLEKPTSYGTHLLFRTSFFTEKLELNTSIRFQEDQIANAGSIPYNTSGLSQFTVAAKYLLYQPEYTDKSKEVRSWKRRRAFDKKRLIPSVALYAGVHIDPLLNSIHQVNQITPKVGVLLQNNFSAQLNLITNVYYDKIGNSAQGLSYIVTGTYNFNDWWSWFLENQGTFGPLAAQNLGAGAAFLYNRKLSFDTSVRIDLDNTQQTAIYVGLGVSYRLDRHQDTFISLDDQGKALKKTIKRKEGNFFSRLFKKFKKKDKKKAGRKRKKSRF